MDVQRYDHRVLLSNYFPFSEHYNESFASSTSMQLCDFGLARKLSDISKTPFAQVGYILFHIFSILEVYSYDSNWIKCWCNFLKYMQSHFLILVDFPVCLTHILL